MAISCLGFIVSAAVAALINSANLRAAISEVQTRSYACAPSCALCVSYTPTQLAIEPRGKQQTFRASSDAVQTLPSVCSRRGLFSYPSIWSSTAQPLRADLAAGPMLEASFSARSWSLCPPHSSSPRARYSSSIRLPCRVSCRQAWALGDESLLNSSPRCRVSELVGYCFALSHLGICLSTLLAFTFAVRQIEPLALK